MFLEFCPRHGGATQRAGPRRRLGLFCCRPPLTLLPPLGVLAAGAESRRVYAQIDPMCHLP